MNKFKQGGWLGMLLALALCVTGAVQAQSDKDADVRNVEVISVEGNRVVVRDEQGTNEYTVPSTFEVTVGGKPVALADLKAGMKGTATVTQFTSVRPVHVTNINMGTVVHQAARSVIVKNDDGRMNRFTQSEADERGVRLYMDGKAVRISDLNAGDQLTATVVSSGPPEILTAQDVDAAMAAAGEPVAATVDASAEATAGATAEADAATEAASAPEEAASDLTSNVWLWVLVLLVLAIVIWLLSRRKPKQDVKIDVRK